MSNQVADNSLKQVKEVSDLLGIRATQFAGFLECPKSWWLQTTARVPRQDSPYASVGTAVHAVIERYIRGELHITDFETVQDELIAAGVKEDERIKLYRYLSTLDPYMSHVLGCELSITCPVYQGVIPLTGHLDLVIELPHEEALLIVDHKTNRQFEGPDVWSRKTQQLVYAFMIRRLYPQAKRVFFEIGYVNLETKVRWETNPADDQWLAQRFWEAVQEINVYDRYAEWPERVGRWCQYCPAREDCVTFKRSINSLRSSILKDSPDEMSPLDRYAWIDACLKSGATWRDELKEAILAEAEKGSPDVLEHPRYDVRVDRSARRSINAHAAWGELMHLMNERPEAVASVAQRLDELVTFKVGGWDKFAKEEPAVQEILQRVVLSKEGEPNLKILPKKG